MDKGLKEVLRVLQKLEQARENEGERLDSIREVISGMTSGHEQRIDQLTILKDCLSADKRGLERKLVQSEAAINALKKRCQDLEQQNRLNLYMWQTMDAEDVGIQL